MSEQNEEPKYKSFDKCPKCGRTFFGCESPTCPGDLDARGSMLLSEKKKG